MYKLRRFYYQNKVKIWRYILIIASILIVIQFSNYMIKVKNKNVIESANKNSLNTNKTDINTNNTDTYITSNKSSVTGEKIENTSLEKASKTIDNFVSACNIGNIEEAYNYLSKDCKEELYPDINKFKTLYYDTIFGGSKKIVTAENWLANTYKVNITEDLMVTGKTNGMKTQDYITIVKDGEDLKLNINSFVSKEELNITQVVKNINVIVICKKIYMDYEEYDIQVENQTNGRILLDSKKDTKSIYLQDNNGMKYYSYSNEILSSLLKVNKGYSTKLKVKFSKAFSKDRITNSIVFSDVILNYNDVIDDRKEKNIIKIEL